MKTIYKTQRSDIVEALNEIERFKDKMDRFMEDHPNYDYEINIIKKIDLQKNRLWELNLTVIHNEY